jgi:hypothetical protein
VYEVFKPNRLGGHRYVLHEINHTVLLIDITPISIPREIIPPEGKAEDLLSLRFQAWKWAEKFLLDSGASRDNLDKTRDSLTKTSMAIVSTLD